MNGRQVIRQRMSYKGFQNAELMINADVGEEDMRIRCTTEVSVPGSCPSLQELQMVPGTVDEKIGLDTLYQPASEAREA